MRGLLLNTLMAVVWALFSGEMSLRELAVGFLLGFLLLALFPGVLGSRAYLRSSLGLLGFLGFFIKQLTLANIQVALLALRPHPDLNPMLFSVPMRLQGSAAQTLLVAIVTLMPGSVVLGFSPDRRIMYVHAIGLANTSEARKSIYEVEAALLAFLPQANREETRL